MKLKFLLTVTLVLLCSFITAQNMNTYSELIKKADELYYAKNYTQSASTYEDAFNTIEGKATLTDRYNAACSYSLANNAEKAFHHLFRLAENGKNKYRNYNHITKDSDLSSLHSDKRWKKLLDLVLKNKQEYEKNLDIPLRDELLALNELDQKHRRKERIVENKYGRKSKEIDSLWKVINQTDAKVLKRITEILDTQGWVGSKKVGDRANGTLFLVIQHANLETQVKYLPMMREAVKKGNARASSLALLEDRVALRQGKRQIYGSQIGRNPKTGEFYVSPIEDPENVNKRRKDVGLGSLESYISNWDIKWDIEAHKKKTKELEGKKGN